MFDLFRPAIFAIDPERAHDLSLTALAGWARAGAPLASRASDPVLSTRVAGIDFANPLGLAAGADKNGRAIAGWWALGFGAAEVGTLTPLPQPGNPRPRLFRLPEDKAVINRFGFNNHGLVAGLARTRKVTRTGVLGINVGANKNARDRIADYRAGVVAAREVADYITVNISSPNTPGLRDLQHGADLTDLLAACVEASNAETGAPRAPVFLKVAPDLTPAGVDEVARAAIDAGIDALIIGNTTISRPPLRARHADETGGLSGAPLAALARQRLADFRAATGASLPLVAAGGIGNAEEAYARIRAGASLVQVYSAMIYEGPGLPARITRGLAALLRRDGFASVAEAVGTAPR